MFLILQLTLLLIIFLFLNFFSFLFSRKILIDLILDVIFCLFIFSFFILCCSLFFHIQFEIEYTYWVNSFLLKVKWAFILDNLNSLMLCFICIIAGFVILFSLDYLYLDPYLIKFLSYLFLFTFFMLILITGQHFLQLFLGWEGVGLCSYLLIGFWSTRVNAHKSALKALVINRIGDIFLLFSFCYLYYYMRSLDFNFLFLLIPFFQNIYINFFFIKIKLLSLICFFLLIGAIGKSAQIGLHTWLPDAMEGPTPVSALIHAATMVTAGVFLIVKCSFIFEFSNNILLLIMFLGGLTAIFASTIGFVQYDLKKIIAYSTCSQLGLMFFICGLSCYSLGFFHLLTHACFKALLFLVAGALIHQVQDEQDLRKFGGLFNLLPFIYTVLLIGSIALMGFPFLAGFYSKDLIIESILFFDYDFILFFQFLILLITAGTCLYSLRLLFKTFFWFPNGFFSVYVSFHNISFFIFFVLFLLTLFSIFMGFLLSEIFSISGSLYFANVLFYFVDNFFLIENEFLPYYIKIIPLILSISVSLSYLFFLELRYFLFFFYSLNYISFSYLSKFKFILNLKLKFFLLMFFDFFFFFYKKFYLFHLFCIKKWFFDSLQNKIFVFFFLNQSFNFFFFIDKGFLELFGPLGINKFFFQLGVIIIKLHNFYIDSYYLFVFLFFFILF